jgi:cysteine desulfurase
VGALYVRRGVPFAPLLTGGPQEDGRRAGTENVPGIVGLGRAAELSLERLGRAGEIAALRDRLEAGLCAALPGVRRHGAGAPRLPNTTNLAFEGLSGEALVTLLSELGVCASTGSACASGKQAASHVLQAMGCDLAETSASLRLSLGQDTTSADVDAALERIPQAVRRLRALAGSARPAPAAGGE